ncbi:hypothetical protein B0H10DRAFT_512467 [Mycena sp. CBHHK59/15]|nr:hypothetical protein B0H10DRAFT_512467 [Mycena sp. CBHHK59/15]
MSSATNTTPKTRRVPIGTGREVNTTTRKSLAWRGEVMFCTAVPRFAVRWWNDQGTTSSH